MGPSDVGAAVAAFVLLARAVARWFPETALEKVFHYRVMTVPLCMLCERTNCICIPDKVIELRPLSTTH